MASYETLKSGKVRVYIYVNGKRKTATLANKQKARSWAREMEVELSKQTAELAASISVADLFKRYADEISPQKKGGHWEIVRLNAFLRYETLCKIKLGNLEREDFEDWVEMRLSQVKPSSVNRELSLIGHCLTQARRWRYMTHNPLKDLERPKNPLPRDRRVSKEEEREICIALGYREGMSPKTKSHFAAIAFLFALETGMRAGEICLLCQALIDFDKAVAHLPDTKNGHPRNVPLSSRAITLLKLLPVLDDNYAPIFQSKPKAMGALFRKYLKRTTIENLTFHDSRHEAITRLAEKIEVLDLARMVGHRDIRQLMTYYNKSAADIAKQLG